MVVGEIVQERDVIIIGGGPGGYNAAIRASQLGLEVTLIEKGSLGGSCLHNGCIPSKLYAHAGEVAASFKHIKDLGFEIEYKQFTLNRLLDYKKKLIQQFEKGIETLCQKYQVEIIKGSAFFLDDERISVETDQHYEIYRGKQIVIATGLEHRYQANGSNRSITYSELYDLTELPEHLILYGNNVHAIEAAFTFKQLGSEVSLVYKDGFGLDSTIEKELFRQFKKAKIKVYATLTEPVISYQESSVCLTFNSDKQNKLSVEGSYFVQQNKSTVNNNTLGLDRLDIKRSEEGFIIVDKQGRTSKSHIFAIGDITNGKNLASLAIKQGKVAAETIAGKLSEVDQTFVPTIIYANPPIASVGLTEEDALRKYGHINIGHFPFGSNGYAALIGKKDGIIKVISEKKSDRILGIHCIGTGAIELIGTGVLGLEMVARTEDMTFPFYPHPSLNEALLESVEDIEGMSIHAFKKKLTLK